jgi:hypothetical protein
MDRRCFRGAACLPLTLKVVVTLFALCVPGQAQTTHTVRAGGDLQAAINAAAPGDTILLEPGVTYSGNFTLPVKSGNAYITIRSAAADSRLPAEDKRIDPTMAAWLPKLRSPNTLPALQTAAGAHHYRLLFLEFLANASGAGTIVALGDGSSRQNTLASVPYELIVDRVYIHGDPVAGQKRGIGLNSASTKILNSYISEIKAVGQDSQAIGGWNGPGPYVISNNYLEGAGENVMFGGSDPAIPGLVPSDITFTRNHVAKPLAWRGSAWTVKNLFELKSAQRVVIDRNLFENNWVAAQAGSAILMKSVNQDGTAPWSVVQDVKFTNNIVRNVSSAVNILGRDALYPAVEANRLTFRNNLFTNVSGSAFGGAGRFLLINGGSDIVFDHNTVMNDGSSTVYGDTTPVTRFVFTNNVILDNAYGIKGSGTGEGVPTLTTYFPGSVVAGNIVAGAEATAYPIANFYPAVASVGFADYDGGDYRLGTASAFKLAATDGSDPGVAYDALTALPPQEPKAPAAPAAPTAPATSTAPQTPPATPSAPAGGPGSPSAPALPAENTHVPHGVVANVAGSTVAISWNPPASGGVLQYVLEAGSAPGIVNIARLETGHNATSLVAQDVPTGTYFIRLRAVTSAGIGQPSSDARFVVGGESGCASAPAAPTNVAASITGGAVQLTWATPGGACAPTHYLVQAGSASGLSDLAQVTVGGQGLAANAPPGTYFVRVLAINAHGASAASNEIVLSVTP